MTELATFLALALATLSTGPAGNDAPGDVRLLATSAPSARAVVALEGKDLEVVEPGDALGDSGMTVVRVLPRRLEIELSDSGPSGDRIRSPRRAWIDRVESSHGSSRILFLDREAPPSPPRRAPRARRSSSGVGAPDADSRFPKAEEPGTRQPDPPSSTGDSEGKHR